METIRIPFKNDDFGNLIFASLSWSKDDQSPKPIALVYHGGGLLVGSSDVVPKPQIEYLANQGFVVVNCNYRLAPQVTAKYAFRDCEDAYDWATSVLPGIMKFEHALEIDSSKVVAYGHSSGGTIALHIASCKPVKAVTAFYPSLFTADTSTTMHQPTSAPPFGLFPEFSPTEEDWASIKPEGKQLSEAPLGAPGTPPAPRTKWQMDMIKHGRWPAIVAPDRNYAIIDPMSRLHADWPPTMIVQGELDAVPGSGLELAQRAEKEMKAAGVKKVLLEVVQGEAHMFDLPPMVGTTDLGPKWQAVVKGLNWLKLWCHKA